MEMIVEIRRERSFKNGKFELISKISIEDVMEKILVSYRIPRKIDNFIAAYYEAENLILAFMNELNESGNQFQEGLLGRLVIDEKDFDEYGAFNVEKVLLKVRDLLPADDGMIFN